MPSYSLYAPIIDSSAPAFSADGSCILYFSLSKYSSSVELPRSIHISVIDQTTGQSVVNKVDNANEGRYRSSGIIILNNINFELNSDNLYPVEIRKEDIQHGDHDGWVSGRIYKIQLRLSAVPYSGGMGQSAWLNINANNFSEWSTYCTTKATSMPTISIPLFSKMTGSSNISGTNKEKKYIIRTSTVDFTGSYSNDDESETLYSYKLQLYDNNDVLLEDSDSLYTNQYYTPNQFHYLFKHELQEGYDYVIKLSYITINRFSETYTFNISVNQIISKENIIGVVTADTIDTIEDPDYVEDFNNLTWKEIEEEEGRIAIKFYSPEIEEFNGNICLRRADSRDNFTTWTDIKIVTCINKPVNQLDIIYDNTIESGVWYKYGAQTIETNGERSILNEMVNPVQREFEYAFLLGEGGRQLKLKYNNTMNSYVYNYLESKTDTIGGQYPYITRNGNTKYRTIPINGLISFNMDENELFTNDKDLYKYNEVIDQYKRKRTEVGNDMYDYKREHDFRERALAFLQDGKPKLFKSSTEGNMIVRLMSVSAQPNQTLNRMIYSFTSTAHEVAEATMENYLKYGFYEVGDYSTSFGVYTTKIGQLDLDFNVGDNIIDKIFQKYDHSAENIAGKKISVEKINYLSLEFTDKPLRVKTNQGELVMGNNFSYGSETFTVKSDFSRKYVFDESISFGKGASLIVRGDENGDVNTVHITVDFLYDVSEEPYLEKQIETRESNKGIGQIYGNYEPGTNLYNEVYYKFYYEWRNMFRRLNRLSWTCIEAAPGAVFQLQDSADSASGDPKTMYHDIGFTGILNLEGLGNILDIRYVGMRNSDGTIDTTKKIDIMVDYIYYTLEGTYKED